MKTKKVITMEVYDRKVTAILSPICSLFILVPILLMFYGDIGNVSSTMIPWKMFIVALLKIFVCAFNAVYIFRLFYLQEKHYVTDAKHLFAWQFLIMTISKIYELYIADLSEGNLSVLENEIRYLPILKVRWILMVLTVAPTFFFFIKIYSKVWSGKYVDRKGINVSPEELENIGKKIELGVDIGFLVIFSLLTLISPNYTILKALGPLIMLPLMIIGIITFSSLRKTKRLPQLNSLLIMIGYYILLTSNILRAFVPSSDVVIIFEGVETIGFLLMGLAFIIPPPYGRAKKKPRISVIN
ncbi:MAG: hypothetical protein GF364_05165 [Candidatus Lokiarchaeota archaeon]|nr:hypothetical protein [Candidatus Lokiarchaeota archaeon]